MSKKKRGEKKRVAEDLSTREPSKGGDQEDAPRGRKQARRKRTEQPAAFGMPGSRNPERRCTATVRSTGERCKRAAIKGGNVCTSHGGAARQVRKAAKTRLLELVDPALAALHAVLTNPETDDTTKVRAAVAVLDRTGFKPGVVVEVDTGDRWAKLLDGALLKEDRSLGSTPEDHALMQAANMQQLANDARDQAWRRYEAEDAEAYERGRLYPDENTISGEVVHPAVSRYDVPADRGPTDPPRYADEASDSGA